MWTDYPMVFDIGTGHSQHYGLSDVAHGASWRNYMVSNWSKWIGSLALPLVVVICTIYNVDGDTHVAIISFLGAAAPAQYQTATLQQHQLYEIKIFLRLGMIYDRWEKVYTRSKTT